MPLNNAMFKRFLVWLYRGWRQIGRLQQRGKYAVQVTCARDDVTKNLENSSNCPLIMNQIDIRQQSEPNKMKNF